MLGWEAFRMAGRSLRNHPGRSILTILGVVIGIGSVIAIVSLGAAFEKSITDQFDAIDDRSIFVTCGQTGPQNGPPDCGQSTFVFTEVDRAALAALDGVERVIASGEVVVSSISYAGQDRAWESVEATTADADEVRNAEDYLEGGPFQDGASEVVLGYTAAKYLSGATAGQEPTIHAGDTILVRFGDNTTRSATVTGILAKQEALFGTNNNQIFTPVDPFYNRLIQSPTSGDTVAVYAGFTVIAEADASATKVQDAVEAYMQDQSDAIRFIAGVEGIDLFVATASDIQAQIGQAFDQVTLFIAAIAGVSLVVGGVMIGTIMLISVTERTKEIGVMKAIGGRDRDILWLFLLEAAIIGVIGSIIGIAIGLGGGAALLGVIPGLDGVSFVFPWDWVGYSILVGIGTGILAGFFPARRATKVQPVEALSYE